MGRAHKDNHSNSRLTFTTKVVQVEHLAQPLSLTKSSVHVSYLLLTLLLSLASPKIGRTLTSKSSQFKGKDKNKTKRVTRQIKQEVSPSSFSSRQVLLVSRKRDSLDLAQLGKVPKSITWSQKVRTIRNWKKEARKNQGPWPSQHYFSLSSPQRTSILYPALLQRCISCTELVTSIPKLVLPHLLSPVHKS